MLYTAIAASLVAALKVSAFPVADGATYQCHADCGYAILAARECDGDESCLCADDSKFMELIPGCLDCGWCLYDNYFPSLVEPLGICGLPTEPTGTQCKEDEASSTSAPEESSSATEESSATSAPETSEAAETTEAEPTSEAQSETTESAPETTEEAETSSAPETTEAPETSSAPESSSAVVPTYTGGANKAELGAAGAFIAGAVALLI